MEPVILLSISKIMRGKSWSSSDNHAASTAGGFPGRFSRGNSSFTTYPNDSPSFKIAEITSFPLYRMCLPICHVSISLVRIITAELCRPVFWVGTSELLCFTQINPSPHLLIIVSRRLYILDLVMCLACHL